jgi:hypothetical protein
VFLSTVPPEYGPVIGVKTCSVENKTSQWDAEAEDFYLEASKLQSLFTKKYAYNGFSHAKIIFILKFNFCCL